MTRAFEKLIPGERAMLVLCTCTGFPEPTDKNTQYGCFSVNGSDLL